MIWMLIMVKLGTLVLRCSSTGMFVDAYGLVQNGLMYSTTTCSEHRGTFFEVKKMGQTQNNLV